MDAPKSQQSSAWSCRKPPEFWTKGEPSSSRSGISELNPAWTISSDSWNGLMLAPLRCAQFFDGRFLQAAIKNAEFVMGNMITYGLAALNVLSIPHGEAK